MLDIGQIDRETSAPLFEQIKDVLREAIISGHLAPGQRLPTETKLAEHFSVTRTTVRRPVQELRLEGLLVPASGRGMAVRRLPSAREASTALDPTPSSELSSLMSQALTTDIDAAIFDDATEIATLLTTLSRLARTQADMFDVLKERIHTGICRQQATTTTSRSQRVSSTTAHPR